MDSLQQQCIDREITQQRNLKVQSMEPHQSATRKRLANRTNANRIHSLETLTTVKVTKAAVKKLSDNEQQMRITK